MEYDEIVRLIKRILRNEKAIREAVAEKREQMAPREEVAGRAPGHISKPTEAAALQNLTPIDFIYFYAGWNREKTRLDAPEVWLVCIDEVRAALEPWEQKFMSRAFTSQDWQNYEDLNVSRNAYYAIKKEIVAKIAVKAAARGLLEV